MYHTLTHYNVIVLNQSTGAISIVSFVQVCVCVSVSADVFVHLSLSSGDLWVIYDPIMDKLQADISLSSWSSSRG